MDYIKLPIKNIVRKLNGLNMILAAATMSLATYSSVNWFIRPTISPVPKKNNGIEIVSISEKPFLHKVANNSIKDYEAVSTKNIFRPDRSEYIPPPPPKKATAPPRRNLPKPELHLDGVITTGNNNGIAMISGHYFNEKSRVTINYQKYRKGDNLGYYKLVEIGRKIVILEDDYTKDKITLSMKFSGYKSSQHSSSATVTENKPTPKKGAELTDVTRKKKYIPNGKRSLPKTGGGSRVEIPAVYMGGKAYYPKDGAPTPNQSISGTKSTPTQHISGR